jgi:phosphatidylglycerophosphate synthase
VVRKGPLVGMLVQLVLLAVLSWAVGLGLTAWLTASAYGIVTCVTLSHGMRKSDRNRLGPADLVTLTRAILVGGVTALTLTSTRPHAVLTLMIALAAVALVLDGVDGRVARRTGTASPLGARFDMEVDAFLILVLSVFVARSYGAWVLSIGAMRYAFVAAAWILSWMRGSLPPRYWRKVVAATQGIVLAVASAGVLPRPLTVIIVIGALLLLVESFGRDVVWLWWSRIAAAPVSAAPLLRARPGPIAAKAEAGSTAGWPN